MEKYILLDALVAEIEKYISSYKGILNKVDKSSDDWVDSTLMLESKIDVLQHVLSFIDTLEVKEANLEKELNDWRHNYFHGRRDIEARGEYLDRVSQLNLAKHFFELGLKVKKGERYGL